MGCLTPTQFGVLAQLSIHPGLIQSELARRNLVRPQSVDELIRSLIDRGLVDRAEGTGRGRARIVTITQAGRDLLDEIVPPLLHFNSPQALGLDPAETVTLNELLHKVLAGHLKPDPHEAARRAGDRR